MLPKVYIDELIKGLYVLRVDDDKVKYFEALWYIPEGVTYNSYLLLTNKGAMLFDAWKEDFSDIFIDSLREVIDLKSIKYVVIHHIEPDHSGSLPRLLQEIRSEAIMIGHPLVKDMLQSFYGIKPRFKTIKDLETISFGDKELQFIFVPWLHWPETVMTYVKNMKVLLTCDAFGGFGIPPTLYDECSDVIEWYKPYVKKYIVDIIGHYKDFIVKNIDKLMKLNLDIKVIAPAHGLIWKNNPKLIIDYYYRLAKAGTVSDKVVIIYSSMYGFVEDAVNKIRKLNSSYGLRAIVFQFTDKVQSELSDILSEVYDSKALILGISTYEANIFPKLEYVIRMLIHKVNIVKPLIALVVYGWGSVVVKRLEDLLRGSKFKVVDIIPIKGKVGDEDIIRIKKALHKVLT